MLQTSRNEIPQEKIMPPNQEFIFDDVNSVLPVQIHME
jgi:hypothetical protein